MQPCGAQAKADRTTSGHATTERSTVDSLIENMWKGHYQKDLLQSLKQNASIKYNILLFKYETDI